jgi:four helix bundle protein
MTLEHENLDAYRASLAFLSLVRRTVTGVPDQRRGLAERLERAAIAVPLSIADGARAATAAERQALFAQARSSALACAAMLDVASLWGDVTRTEHDTGKRLLGRLVGMLALASRAEPGVIIAGAPRVMAQPQTGLTPSSRTSSGSGRHGPSCREPSASRCRTGGSWRRLRR